MSSEAEAKADPPATPAFVETVFSIRNAGKSNHQFGDGPVTTDTVRPAAPSVRLDTSIPQYVARMVADSTKRIEQAKAVVITTNDLQKKGIHRLGLGDGDSNRIKLLSTTFEVNGGNIDPIATAETGLHSITIYPSHIIDTTVLIAKDTTNCAKAVAVALNAFSVVRSEVNKKYEFAADYVLEVAVKNHAKRAYSGYIKILAINNNIDKMSVPRAEAIANWVYTLRADVEKAKTIADYMEKAKKEAFLSSMAAKEYNDDESGSDADDEDEDL